MNHQHYINLYNNRPPNELSSSLTLHTYTLSARNVYTWLLQPTTLLHISHASLQHLHDHLHHHYHYTAVIVYWSHNFIRILIWWVSQHITYFASVVFLSVMHWRFSRQNYLYYRLLTFFFFNVFNVLILMQHTDYQKVVYMDY